MLQATDRYMGPRGFSQSDMESIGYGSVRYNPKYKDPNSYAANLDRMSKKTEYFGFYNFAAGFLKNLAPGDFGGKDQLVSTAAMISP